MKNELTRKETLIKARDEWDAANVEQNAKYEAQYAEFRKAQKEIFDGIKNQVLTALKTVNLNLGVEVDTAFNMRQNDIRVCVGSNNNRVHAENKALSWSWEVSLKDDGSVDKKSSSWSGLQATTEEQIESLYQTADALYILNGLDWLDIFNVTLPDWKDYITEKSSIGERPKFEADIRAAEIAELIGTNTLIKGSPSGGKSRATAWYLVISETPKQFKVAELANYSVQENYLQERKQTLAQAVEQSKKWANNITKEKFMNDVIDVTIETMKF